MVTDTLGDMLARIKNASLVRKAEVSLPYSKLCESVALVMAANNYLKSVTVVGEGTAKNLVLKLQYVGNQPAIAGARRISKPGVRIYKSVSAIRPVLSGLGISIFTTSRGIMSGVDAKKAKLGGEVLVELW